VKRLTGVAVVLGALFAACSESSFSGLETAPATLAPAPTATLPSTTTTLPPTTTTLPPTTTTEAVIEVRIAATGDLLTHEGVVARATAEDGTVDFTRLLADAAPLIAATDFAICHMEVPMGGDELGFQGYPTFNAPEALASGVVATGFDACTTASNHSIDQGTEGLRNTLDTLDAAGLGHAGTYRTAAEQSVPLIVDVGGIAVALLAYTYGLNGLVADNSWDVNVIDPAAIVAEAQRARDAGAELVMVNLHWGEEYRHSPTAFQEELARILTASPFVDLVVGQHAHVVQPISAVNGKFVVWGEGNFMGNSLHDGARTRDGLVALITVRKDGSGVRATRVDYVPVYIERHGMRVLPAEPVLTSGVVGGEPAPEELLAAVRDTYDHVLEVVGASRQIAPLPVLPI